MARRSIAERIAQLEARKKALQARLSKQERAVDTAARCFLGRLCSSVWRLVMIGVQFTRRLSDWLRRELPGFLIRENDRAALPRVYRPEPGQQNRCRCGQSWRRAPFGL